MAHALDYQSRLPSRKPNYGRILVSNLLKEVDWDKDTLKRYCVEHYAVFGVNSSNFERYYDDFRKTSKVRNNKSS